MRYRWYDKERKDLLKLLRTDGEKGLTRKEAAERLRSDGKNTINPVEKAPIRGYILQVVSDLTAILMLVTALLAVIYRRDAGAVVMLILLIINYLVTIFSYVRSQKVLEEFGHRAQPTAKVIRNGRLMVVSEESVVQGDVFLLSVGDIVPCDARLLESENLRVFEGNLFGSEAASVKNAEYIRAGLLKPEDAVNMVYASTVVTGGRGRAVAVATGPDTMVCTMGKNRPVAAAHKLKIIERLKKLSSVIGLLSLIPVFLLTFAEMLWGEQLIEVFLSSLSFAVSLMPELYVAFAYLTLAFGMMSALESRKKGEEKRGVFIKNPLALPALAEPDCLLLPLESLYLENDSKITAVFDGNDLLKEQISITDPSYLRVLRYGVISTGLYGASRLNIRNQQSENVYSRDEEAIIEACERAGIYNKSLEENYPVLEHRERGENGSLFETTLVHYGGEDVVVLRGEPQAVLSRCSGYVRKGKIFSMDAYAKSEILGVASSYIKRHCQPIAIATKNSNYSTLMRIVDSQSDLIFEGFLMLEKPLLPGAAKEILKLEQAGIRVLAYTADESEEKRFLAKALGIATEEKQRIQASALPGMKEEIFKIGLKNYTLFEGFDGPQLKYTMECLSDEYGLKTGFCATGSEGVYAMYSAYVGFAPDPGQTVGQSQKEKKGEELRTPLWNKTGKGSDRIGCQALSHLSDVILPPSDMTGKGGINAIGTAIRTARGIFRNVRTLLLYLAYSGAMRFAILLFSLTGRQYLTPVQMLMLGLLWDTVAVFVFALEGAGRKYRPVQGKGKGALFSLSAALLSGAGSAVFTVIASRVLYKTGLLRLEQIHTFCFVTMLFFMASAVTVLLRQGRPAFKNIRFTMAYGGYLLLLTAFFILCAAVPGFGGALGVVLMNGKIWGMLIGWAVLLQLATGVIKAVLSQMDDHRRMPGNKKDASGK